MINRIILIILLSTLFQLSYGQAKDTLGYDYAEASPDIIWYMDGTKDILSDKKIHYFTFIEADSIDVTHWLFTFEYIHNKGYDILTSAGSNYYFHRKKGRLKDTLKFDYALVSHHKNKLTTYYHGWKSQYIDSTDFYKKNYKEFKMSELIKEFSKKGYDFISYYILDMGDNASFYHYIFRRKRY